jgi:hypothetical protein
LFFREQTERLTIGIVGGEAASAGATQNPTQSWLLRKTEIRSGDG